MIGHIRAQYTSRIIVFVLLRDAMIRDPRTRASISDSIDRIGGKVISNL